MTGEITLRGRVLPIGGLREKSLAALQAGLKILIVPDRNRKDVDELPPRARKALDFHFVATMDQVVDLALKPVPAAQPAVSAPPKKPPRRASASR
jgi:ATP-dependent Lon protease